MKTSKKMKRYIKKNPFTVVIILTITLLGLVAHFNLLYATSKLGVIQVTQAREVMEICTLNDVYCEEEMTMQEWVFERLKQNLGEEEAIKGMMIIQCESRWNPDALNVNTNKTADLGLWQINHPLHSKTISRQQSLDYQIATDWAINKRLNDGNWGAWVCSRVLGI